ncbi:MAG: hypothetical protein IJG25_04760 [Thermoguttaceae bacterium]|nr:hypothetical protein [Thermoguttaceae bacterium]
MNRKALSQRTSARHGFRRAAAWFRLLFALLAVCFGVENAQAFGTVGLWSGLGLFDWSNQETVLGQDVLCASPDDIDPRYIDADCVDVEPSFFEVLFQPRRRGLYSQLAGEEFLIRGQSSDYWGTIQQQYNNPSQIAPPLSTATINTTNMPVAQSGYSAYTTPTFIAQTGTASQQPSLGSTASSTSITSNSSTGNSMISGSSIAPPLTDVNTAILQPSPTSPAPPGQTFLNEPVGTMKRFWDSFSANYTFVPRGSSDSGLGIHEFDIAGRFALPCSLIPHANDNSVSGYWYLAPSARMQLWHNPTKDVMPSKTFEVALGVGVRPQFTKDFGGDIWVQVGLANSSCKIYRDSIFIRGRGLGTLRINEYIQAVGGVVYYNRNRFKLLPSAGIVWQPNDVNLWYFVFPNPKFSHFLKKVNDTDWWAYIQGDIGGGSWYMSEDEISQKVDYNDYRVGGGVTFSTACGLAGSFEVGGAFARQVYTRYQGKIFSPNSTVYLKAGIMY